MCVGVFKEYQITQLHAWTADTSINFPKTFDNYKKNACTKCPSVSNADTQLWNFSSPTSSTGGNPTIESCTKTRDACVSVSNLLKQAWFALLCKKAICQQKNSKLVTNIPIMNILHHSISSTPSKVRYHYQSSEKRWNPPRDYMSQRKSQIRQMVQNEKEQMQQAFMITSLFLNGGQYGTILLWKRNCSSVLCMCDGCFSPAASVFKTTIIIFGAGMQGFWKSIICFIFLK